MIAEGDVPLILYVQLVFGNLFVIRTLQIFRARALLSTPLVTKTGTAFVCTSFCVTFFCANSVFLSAGLITGCILLTIAALFAFERHEITELKNELPLFLDRWILNLRLGSALPTARELALNDHSEGFKNLLRPLFAARNTLQNRRGHPLMRSKALAELEKLHLEPHSALQRLENLRRHLRKGAEFRRKSGQATRQTAIQSVVMLLLLIALASFTLHRYGWRRSGDLIAGAAFLSVIGVVSMYLMARKTKWKI